MALVIMPGLSRFCFGIPDKIPSIPGFKVQAKRDEFLTATGKNREWFVTDADDKWILIQLVRGAGVPKEYRDRWYHPSHARCDDQSMIAIPKA